MDDSYPAANVKKVLISGSVNGKLNTLYKRVVSVNASNGPFDALLCLGSFFPCDGAADADFSGELAPYINGEKTAPIPTYFIGGFGLGSTKALAALSNTPQCNIHYLGRSGVTQIQGLQIAYLDGQYHALISGSGDQSQQYFNAMDVHAVKTAIANAEGDIDFLFTNEWPTNLCSGLPESGQPSSPIEGCDEVKEIAVLARPRYHIAAGQGIFYARAPYINPDVGAGTLSTRFISLGDVGNSGKQKWLHALGLTPASKLTPEELASVPQGATKSPFSSTIASKKRTGPDDAEELGVQDWRWQDKSKRRRLPVAAPSLGRADIVKDKSKTIFVRNVPFHATENDLIAFFSQAGTIVDVIRRANQEGKLNTYCHIQFDTKEEMERACQLNESDLMGRKLFIEPAITFGDDRQSRRQVQPVEGCWFCLSNPDANTALVASVGEECYVALDKGAITNDHVLLLPIEHYACSLDAPASTHDELDRYISALRSCFASEGKELVAFERFMRLKKSGGNHAHINIIGIPRVMGPNAASVFKNAASRHGFGFEHLPPARGQEARDAVRSVVQNGEYFIAFLPDGSRLVHPIAYGERHPLNFGREVLAELAGVPHRADWKQCVQATAEEEERRTETFRNVFKKFDIMLEVE